MPRRICTIVPAAFLADLSSKKYSDFQGSNTIAFANKCSVLAIAFCHNPAVRVKGAYVMLQ